MFRGARYPLLAADYVGDFHLDVVHDIGEVVSRPTISLDQDEVVYCIA